MALLGSTAFELGVPESYPHKAAVFPLKVVMLDCQRLEASTLSVSAQVPSSSRDYFYFLGFIVCGDGLSFCGEVKDEGAVLSIHEDHRCESHG